MIGGKHAAQRQHAGQQSANPQNARRDQTQCVQFWAYAQWKQSSHHHKEKDRGNDLVLAPHGQDQIALHDGHKRAHAVSLYEKP